MAGAGGVSSSTQPPAAWVADLLAYRPRVLIGYPVHLRELLRTMTDDERTRLRRHLRNDLQFGSSGQRQHPRAQIDECQAGDDRGAM